MSKTATARVLEDESKSNSVVVSGQTADNDPEKAKASSVKCDESFQKVEAGLKANRQSRGELERTISVNIVDCFNHAKAYGDVRPMDRLVKKLINEGDTFERMIGREVHAWVTKNSPIRWNAKQEPRQAKEGEEGYQPYVENPEMVDPFYGTPQAKKARQAAEAAAKRSLEPLTVSDIVKRVQGLRRTTEAAQKPDKQGETRTIAKGHKKRIELLISGLEQYCAKALGEAASEELEETDAKLNKLNDNAEKGKQSAAA